MEKYGVQIDPEKVPKEKKAGAGNTDPHPETNVPVHETEGTKPYETEKTDRGTDNTPTKSP